MPIYEYECKECSEHFEVSQNITDSPLTTCSLCGGELRKIITNTSFVLKGSGWYVTDYPSSERKKAMDGKKSSDAKKDAQPAKTSDSKKEGALST
ncbi:MAG: zinc ribbon domain-containing protein [Nitrospirae bacterium]|nr:zinc ribbon domain-containing protein [Nitrospirota bacterium]